MWEVLNVIFDFIGSLVRDMFYLLAMLFIFSLFLSYVLEKAGMEAKLVVSWWYHEKREFFLNLDAVSRQKLSEEANAFTRGVKTN